MVALGIDLAIMCFSRGRRNLVIYRYRRGREIRGWKIEWEERKRERK